MEEKNVVLDDIETRENKTVDLADEELNGKAIFFKVLNLDDEQNESDETKESSEETVADSTEEKLYSSSNDTEWYVVNTYAGHENRVKDNLQRRIETMGLQDSLFQILVAEEVEIEFKNGKKIEKTKNLYPGYLFVEMKMTDEAWYVVRNTPGVTGFIGSSGGGAKPFPVSEKEIDTILRRMGLSDKKVIVDFRVGDKVKVENGPFIGLEGTVESMSDESQSAIVLTVLFGRETPTEISYNDIVKVAA